MPRRSPGRARGLFAPADWDEARWGAVPPPDDPKVAGPAGEDEARFVARLVARDERAFNELVKAYERRVFALVAPHDRQPRRGRGPRPGGLRPGLQGDRHVPRRVASSRRGSTASRSTSVKTARKYLRVRHAGRAGRARGPRGAGPAGRRDARRTWRRSSDPTR